VRPLKIDYVEADYLPYANPDVNVLQLNPRALLNHLAAASHTLPFPDTCTRMRATLNLLVAEHGIQGGGFGLRVGLWKKQAVHTSLPLRSQIARRISLSSHSRSNLLLFF
jgi:hypothetical protein